MTGMSAAHLGSISLATSASTAENTSLTPSVVMWAESSTVIPACSADSGSVQCHFEAPLSSFTASANFLPAERLDAASLRISNIGCPASEARNCCPARPVAPTTATGIRDDICFFGTSGARSLAAGPAFPPDARGNQHQNGGPRCLRRALPGDLIEGDGGGDGRVERRDRPALRD